MLLAHPEPENLGRFVEGTLDDSERAAIVQHIADCDDCRMLVVDAAEFIEPAKTESPKWWMGIAASLMLVAAIGTVTYHQLRDLEAGVKKEYAKAPNRPLEARLSGYSYVQRQNMRGGPGDDDDLASWGLKNAASELTTLSGTDAKTLHAKGIGFLLGDKDTKKESIAPLQAAAERDPKNAKYQSDLAAALIAVGSPGMLQSALAATDRALHIDPNLPDALFNRAVALQALDRPDEAMAAYKRYLEVDSATPWADEARKNIDLLRP
jgi:tetratricopeptide (TPR) repeat protein